MKKISIFILGLTLGISSTALATYSVFSDVDPNAYYANAINNVYYKGLITGYDNYNFGPDDNLSRGQMAVVLDRFDEHMANTLKSQFGLTYMCPNTMPLNCTGSEELGSGCKNQDYIDWANANCTP